MAISIKSVFIKSSSRTVAHSECSRTSRDLANLTTTTSLTVFHRVRRRRRRRPLNHHYRVQLLLLLLLLLPTVFCLQFCSFSLQFDASGRPAIVSAANSNTNSTTRLMSLFARSWSWCSRVGCLFADIFFLFFCRKQRASALLHSKTEKKRIDSLHQHHRLSASVRQCVNNK